MNVEISLCDESAGLPANALMLNRIADNLPSLKPNLKMRLANLWWYFSERELDIQFTLVAKLP